MDSLPIELLDIIASQGSDVYRPLLGCKFFTDTLNYSKRLDFMILFGHSIRINKWVSHWYLKGKLHRDNDLPASEWLSGQKEWYQNGERHRIGGPAIEWSYGDKEWWINGKRHRDNDLPAREWSSGFKEWYRNGKLHRDNDLPAVEEVNGTKHWYYKGKHHRDGGPAIEFPNGDGHWYRYGKLRRKTKK